MKNRFSSFLKMMNQEKGLILLCIILGFLAWQGIRKTIGFEVPVSDILVDIDVPEGWAVWEKSVHKVNVLFRGSREDIRYLNNEQMRVVIPVTNPKYGEEIVINLSESFLRNPTSAKVVQFSPSQIVIKLDQKSDRLLPVKAALDGELPDGLQIDRIICSPATVRVSGARKVLDEMDSLHTTPIDLKDRQSSFKESVSVSLPKSSRLQVEPDWVSVECTLIERNSSHTIENVPVQIVSASGKSRRVEVNPSTVTVRVKGRLKDIEQIRAESVFAYITCSELEENSTYEMPVTVQPPQGAKVVETEPAVVQVMITNLK